MKKLKITRKERISALRNLLLCSLPLIFFAIIKTHWIARLLAVSGSCLIANGLLFYHGFKPAVNLRDNKNKIDFTLTKQQTEYRKNIAKGIAISAGMILLTMNIRFFADWFGVCSQGKPYLLEVEGRVKDNNMYMGSFFLDQGLIFIGNKSNYFNCHATYYPQVFLYDGGANFFL